MKLALVRLLLLVGLAPAVLAAQDARGYGIQWYDVPEENYFRQFKEVFESDMAKQFAENNYGLWWFRVRIEKAPQGLQERWLHATGQIQDNDRTHSFDVGFWKMLDDDAENDAPALVSRIGREIQVTLDEMRQARTRGSSASNRLELPVDLLEPGPADQK
ncbi:MAG: hypothetical protein A2722_01035 [Candidatus Doudnabacteria bacterium RIFCSPHIGHO2_01_FULL_50_11]|uniref:Curli production assembly/transport component CsgE n=1 Tax=Candidatus Doudnabacteria bacterium RIFCSPHIGHO2_01_FULL_50_11 TaxID=1817828 RepID=A0A1F5PEU3_9BACT|nr:MAG: hypothetical protein A2722_01035 [Candidatus Doudnabacteria bacterium RIFCSPHIGHO2_01_FULL_50_11]HLC45228.1 hypothetical protein [Patescibacteria group bacterium]